MTSDEARDRVRDQALGVAAGWSPPDAPPSWALTAELFRAIAEEDPLLGLAAAIPADRLPPLLLSAALRYLVARDAPAPLAGYFPTAGSGNRRSTPGSGPPSPRSPPSTPTSSRRSARRTATR